MKSSTLEVLEEMEHLPLMLIFFVLDNCLESVSCRSARLCQVPGCVRKQHSGGMDHPATRLTKALAIPTAANVCVLETMVVSVQGRLHVCVFVMHLSKNKTLNLSTIDGCHSRKRMPFDCHVYL